MIPGKVFSIRFRAFNDPDVLSPLGQPRRCKCRCLKASVLKAVLHQVADSLHLISNICYILMRTFAVLTPIHYMYPILLWHGSCAVQNVCSQLISPFASYSISILSLAGFLPLGPLGRGGRT